MAIPTVVGVGAAVSGAAGVTVDFPASYSAVLNDVGLIFVECDSLDTISPPTGWTVITDSVVSSGSTTKLTALWRRFAPGDAAPAFSDAGNHIIGRMIVLRGCSLDATPWHIYQAETALVTNTAIVITGVTTTVDECLIVVAFGTGNDINSTTGASGWTNSFLDSLTEYMDNWTISGNGGGFAMAAGGQRVRGDTTNTSVTLGLTGNFKNQMTIAFKPTLEPPILVMAPPRSGP